MLLLLETFGVDAWIEFRLLREHNRTKQFGFNLWSGNVGVSQKNLCQIILGFGSTDSVYLKLQRCIGLARAGDYLINIGLLGFCQHIDDTCDILI